MNKHPLRVLLVEDDEDDFLLTRDLLNEITNFDCQTEWAATYAAAQAAMVANQFDVCLIDYRLGERTGLELLREAVAEGFRTPMIMVTGQDEHAVDMEAMEAGAADYLVKGKMEAATLERTIRYALERKRAEEERHRFFTLSQDLIGTIGFDGYFKQVNPMWEKTFGYSVAEMMKKKIVEFIHPDDLALTLIEASHIADGKTRSFEVRMRTRDGSNRWFLWSSIPVIAEKVSYAVGRDITERKRAEEAAQDSRDYLNRIINAVADPIFVKNRQHQLTLVNDEMCRFIGRSREEAIGKTSHELFSAEEADVFWEKDEMAFTSGEENVNEEVFTDLNGDTRVIITRKRLHIDKNGEQFIVGVSRDITESKQTEEALLKNEAKFRDLFDNAPVAYHELDTEGRFTRINRTEELLLGYTNDELKGRHPAEIIVERLSREATAAKLAGTMPLQAVERTFIHKNGSLVSVLNEDRLIYDTDGKVTGIRSTLQNITDRKLAEELIRESEEKYRNILETIEEGYFETDLTGSLTFFNDALSEALGYGRDELIGMNYTHYVDEANAKTLKRFFKDVYKTRQSKFLPNLEIICRNGERRTHESSVSLILDAANKPIGFRGLVREITERQRAEKELQESEMRYRLLFDRNPYPIWVYDVETLEFLAVNEEAIRHYGYSREEFQTLTLKEIRSPEDLPFFRKYADQVAAGIEILHSVKHQKKDGEVIEVEVAVQPINFAGKRARLALITDVTERKRAEKELQESQQLLKLVIDTLPQAIWWKDRELNYIGCNRLLAEAAGFESPEQMIGLNDHDMPWTTEEADFFRECDRRVMETGIAELNIVEPQLQSDGRRVWLNTNKVPLRSASGEIGGVIGTFADITEQRRADAALRESEYKFRTLMESMREGLLQVDNEDRVVFVNECFCQMVGYSSGELLETNWSQLVFDENDDFIKQVNKRRREGISESYEICLRKKSGERLWAIVGGAPTLDAENVVTGSMGVFTDITERKQIEERLLHDAFHDGLTGLANRTLFADHLQLTIDRTKRNRGELFAVLFLDFDRFKVINDSLGHAEGDNLLKQIARRLEFALRSGDLVARVGGDEFTILLNQLNDSSVALRVAERIQKNLELPFEIAGGEIYISASIGIAFSTSGHERAEDMIRNADIAMYRAKAKGKAQHQVFDQAMHEHASKQLRIETEMRQAIERGEFLLHYQPIINLETQTLIGFESLVRWQHPTRGMIPPFEFISVAEENNLIIPLGQWVLHESCRQLRQWQQSNPAAESLTISVNLSSKQFLQSDLAEQIAAALEKTGLDPRCLKLEITESHIMENTEMAARTMNSLRVLGVELSLDDFGTGYSSLSYLHRLPVSYLKIDRSFVMRMTDSEENSEIVRTIIKLGNNLKMKVVAEGIETAAQLAHLKSLRCDLGQGYYFAKPFTAHAAEEYIKENGEDSMRLLNQPTINAKLNV